MFEIGIVGTKNSGKTTLIEALLAELTRRGYHVGTIKHTAHHHTFDKVGRDSYRHRAGGAVMTMAVSKGELAFFAGDVVLYERISTQLMADQCDLCLVEGDRSSHRPKILLTRLFKRDEAIVPTNILASYGSDAYSAETPHFYPNDIVLLAEFIIEKSELGGENAKDE